MGNLSPGGDERRKTEAGARDPHGGVLPIQALWMQEFTTSFMASQQLGT